MGPRRRCGSRTRWLRRAVLASAACVALSSCVLAETGVPRRVGNQRAVVEGRLYSDRGGAAEQWVEYGPTAAYGTTTPHSTSYTVDDAWSPTSAEVTGLTAGSTYHYRLCGRDPVDGRGRCGEDQVLTTGSGRLVVRGTAQYDDGTFSGAEGSVDVAADPSPGYLDGDASITGRAFGTIHDPGPIPWGGGSSASCVRVAGKVATIGLTFTDPILGTRRVALVVEDNGPTGDRFDAVEIASPTACPTPSSALIGTGFVGRTRPVDSGDFQIG